ncbi:MAG TPA: hypothetical protein VF538_13735 [Pyrinomonadaceae bacterium]|jgi:hypothetical protein
MRNFYARRAALASLAAPPILLLLSPGVARGQGVRPSTPDLNRRLESEKSLRDNERLRRGMEADGETRAHTKEERQSLANEAFMRLQQLHNQMLAMALSGETPDPARVAEAVAETRKRAVQLRENLVLPDPAKDDKREKGAEPGPKAAAGPVERLSKLCAHIQSFVINLNNSPTNKKAGAQARRELDSIIEVSDEMGAGDKAVDKRDH